MITACYLKAVIRLQGLPSLVASGICGFRPRVKETQKATDHDAFTLAVGKQIVKQSILKTDCLEYYTFFLNPLH